MIHRAGATAAEIEIPTSDVTSFVLEHAAERADKPALIDGPSGRTLSYGELAEGIAALAAGLAGRGLREGRRARRLHAERARVRGRLPRRRVGRRQVHDREPALHRQRARPSAQRLGRADADHRAAVPRRRARGRRAGRDRGPGLRARRGRGGDAVRRPARRSRRGAGGRDRSRGRPRRAAVLERHHRACPRA